MEKKTIVNEYQKNKDLYSRLGQNIVEALKTFLTENNIGCLDIYYRIKEFDSFYEKIDRKGYKNPFDEIEDICGIRVICYYASDVEKIKKIISDEFEIIEEQNKSELLGLKEFAYRSQHFIVKINKEWNAAPNYRKLENLKVEIQVRTILMHAWAEIEHKLNYKSDAQVPDKFQRKLFRLSAKFEEADEQFDELKTGINEYKSQLKESISTSKKFDINQDFNLETFKAFIKFHFPDIEWTDNRISLSFEEFSKNDKNFEMLENAIKKAKPHHAEILKDLKESGYEVKSNDTEVLLWFAMDVVDEETFLRREKITIDSWKNVMKVWRDKLK
jgi:putative GTP pyrophosphokinase